MFHCRFQVTKNRHVKQGSGIRFQLTGIGFLFIQSEKSFPKQLQRMRTFACFVNQCAFTLVAAPCTHKSAISGKTAVADQLRLPFVPDVRGTFVAVAYVSISRTPRLGRPKEPRLILFSEKGKKLESCKSSWYALQVWSRKELYVSSQLQNLGYECFLPTYRVQRKWSDRVKEVERPLFPGYLFSRFDFHNRRGLVMSPGVIHIVGNGKTPLPVPDLEIERLQIAVTSEAPKQPWPYLAAGEAATVWCYPSACCSVPSPSRSIRHGLRQPSPPTPALQKVNLPIKLLAYR
jgi:Transcription termination factor nusG